MFAVLLRMMNSLSHSLPFSVLLLVFSASLFSLTLAQPNFWFYSCGKTGNYTNPSAFAANLNTVVSDIISSSEIANSSYHFYTAGTKPGVDLVTGAAFCRGDLPSSECHSCYSDAAVEIRQVCPTQKQAIAWYTDCMVRYSDHSIRGTMESSPKYSVHNPANASDPEAFDLELKALLRSLQVKAKEDPSKYASGSRRVSGSVSVYAVLGCTPDMNASDCFKCAEDVINYVSTCCYGKIGASIFTPNCASRFDVYQFYRSDNRTSTPSAPLRTKGNSRGKKRSLFRLSLSIAIPTFVAVLLSIGIWICLQRRKATLTGDREAEVIMDVECLQFDLTAIKAATHNFSMDNKLGEGGFGAVYKGTLACGQEVAVKRLSKNSGQGIAEFKNEVALVAKLQHKNLVKLLGFCISLKERILVYEFLPNSSLDRFLFDSTRSSSLNWETRFKIICGIARGLLYLHEDSRLKVIHRDLKSSNILLDESMNPKISDFGLAKLFGADQTQGNTNRIVGTYGYMAPEYAMTGHFSVKSDVFSFGIILLEIVSGQRNRSFAHRPIEETLLHRVWRFWNEEQVLDLVDPRLENEYKLEEITKCIHISLLCIQEDPARRPKMTSVVAALNGDSISLPMPRTPQFFGNVTTSGDESVSFNSFTITENITVVSPR